MKQCLPTSHLFDQVTTRRRTDVRIDKWAELRSEWRQSSLSAYRRRRRGFLCSLIAPPPPKASGCSLIAGVNQMRRGCGLMMAPRSSASIKKHQRRNSEGLCVCVCVFYLCEDQLNSTQGACVVCVTFVCLTRCSCSFSSLCVHAAPCTHQLNKLYCWSVFSGGTITVRSRPRVMMCRW